MSSSSRWTLAVVGGLAVLAYLLARSSPQTEIVEVDVPVLTSIAQDGEGLFNENCAGCHGENGAGSEQGPPLIHPVYTASHHADGAFLLAVRTGVRAHHWRFGNMPPQPQISDPDLERIVQFVREVQRANGI